MNFEWDNGPRSVFSVAVGRDGSLTYAGLDGGSKSQGVETFGEPIPATVREGIARVVGRV